MSTARGCTAATVPRISGRESSRRGPHAPPARPAAITAAARDPRVVVIVTSESCSLVGRLRDQCERIVRATDRPADTQAHAMIPGVIAHFFAGAAQSLPRRKSIGSARACIGANEAQDRARLNLRTTQASRRPRCTRLLPDGRHRSATTAAGATTARGAARTAHGTHGAELQVREDVGRRHGSCSSMVGSRRGVTSGSYGARPGKLRGCRMRRAPALVSGRSRSSGGGAGIQQAVARGDGIIAIGHEDALAQEREVTERAIVAGTLPAAAHVKSRPDVAAPSSLP